MRTAAVHEFVALEAVRAAVPVASADQTRTVTLLWRHPHPSGPVQLAARTEFVQEQAVELGPHPGLAPFGEPPVGRRTRWSERRGQLPPRAA